VYGHTSFISLRDKSLL